MEIRTVIFGRHQAQERVALFTANIAVADCRGIKINTNTARHSPVSLEFIDLIMGYHRTGQFAGSRRAKPGENQIVKFFLGSGKSASSCGITLGHSLRDTRAFVDCLEFLVIQSEWSSAHRRANRCDSLCRLMAHLTVGRTELTRNNEGIRVQSRHA